MATAVKVLPLQPAEEQQLQTMRHWVYGGAAAAIPAGSAGKLDSVIELIDSNVVSPTHRWKQQALGVVFGDALVQVTEQHLSWVFVHAPPDSTFALRWERSNALIYPLSAIGERMANSEAVDVRTMYSEYLNALPFHTR